MADQEVGNLAVKVSMDLTGFQNGISNLNRQMRIVQSEFQAATAGLGNFEKTTEGLRLKVDSLNKQIDLQKQKVAALEGAYQKSLETKGADAKATQELEIKLNKARAALASMEADLKTTTAELEKQSSAWYQAAQRAEAAGNKMKSAGEAIGNVGKTLSVAVTLPLVGIGTAATKMAMDAVESENLFAVSMGKMAGAARKWSEDISKSLGLNAFEVRKNVATFNVMLNSMGLAEKQAYDMSTSLTKLAYDMASFYNLKPEEAFEKLRAGISGETEPLKELGINLLDTQVKTYAWTNGIAQQGKELTEQQKILARYGLMMQATSKAQGDLARTIDSPTNKVRIMTQQIQQLGIQFGQILIPVLERLLAAIKPVVDWFSSLSVEQQKLVIVLAGVAAGIGPVLIGIANLITAVGSISLAFGKVATAVSNAGGVIGLLTNPIGIAIGAIALLAGAAYLIIKNWDSIKTFFSSLWESIKNGAIAGWESIKAAISGAITGLINSITGAWENIKATTIAVWDGIKNAVVGAFQWMYDHNYYFQAMVDFIRNAWNVISEFSISVWSGIKDTLAGIWDAIRGAISERWQAIQNVTVTVWTAISGWLSGLWTRIQGQVSAAWNAIYGVISGVWARIKEGFNSMVTAAWDWGRNLMNNFIEGFRAMFSRLWDALSEAANAVAGFLGFHSPTELGPGRDADKWAPALVRMYAEGIKKSLPELQASLNAMALTLTPASLAGATTYNTTYNQGSYTIIFQVTQGWDQIERELARRGIRF